MARGAAAGEHEERDGGDEVERRGGHGAAERVEQRAVDAEREHRDGVDDVDRDDREGDGADRIQLDAGRDPAQRAGGEIAGDREQEGHDPHGRGARDVVEDAEAEPDRHERGALAGDREHGHGDQAEVERAVEHVHDRAQRDLKRRRERDHEDGRRAALLVVAECGGHVTPLPSYRLCPGRPGRNRSCRTTRRTPASGHPRGRSRRATGWPGPPPRRRRPGRSRWT